VAQVAEGGNVEPSIEAHQTVLTIVDYQNDFCHEDGAIAELGQSTRRAREILPSIEELLAAARAAGVPRVFVRVAHSQWTDTPAWLRRGAGGTIIDAERRPIAREGTWGAELYKLVPQPDELVLTKHRYSAFAHTPLALILQAQGAETVTIAGVQTNVCVHASARDALQHGFVPVVVEDCVAAGTDLEHQVALEDIRARIGRVVSLEELRRSWGIAGRPAEGSIESA
jgi:ureidoacrylate peracid hydrolase